jgi:hypothetical protein
VTRLGGSLGTFECRRTDCTPPRVAEQKVAPLSTTAGLTLTPSLVAGAEDRAITVLQAYVTPVSGPNVGFTGGAFDTFDPSGTRSASTNTFTADDLVAVSLLSVDVPGRCALEILDRQRRRYFDRTPLRELPRSRPIGSCLS